MSLEHYRKKRDFGRTPEPVGGEGKAGPGNQFVVQYHRARRAHYDFRLEWDGTLKSWAVPKGPCLDPKEKRLAVRVEDHPLEYAQFEGVIPQGEYGAGTVIVWDTGTWEPIEPAEPGFRNGMLKFRLYGRKLRGAWMLVRMKPKANDRTENWLLVKERDQEVVRLEEADILLTMPNSVLSGRGIDEVAQQPEATWKQGRSVPTDCAGSTSNRDGKPKRASQLAAPKGIAESTNKRLSKGKAKPFPEWIEPQLADVADSTPDTDQWIHEIKFDGYRLLARIHDGKVSLWTRKKQNWTQRFPGLARTLSQLEVKDAYLDGEVVALLPNGVSSFSQLQTAFKEGRADSLVYFVFDLLYLDGRDQRELPLDDRKRKLASLFPNHGKGVVQYTDHFEGNGPEFFRQCCKFGLEGIISKRRDRPYRSGRTFDWLKSKCIQIDQFVIGGWTDPSGSRLGFGALVLGYYNPAGELIYAGRVGTGFTESTLLELKQLLAQKPLAKSPFANLSDRQAGREFHWVQPELVAQVQFANWTMDGLLWHPSFQGIREDISPREVVRNRMAEPAEPPRPAVPQKVAAPKASPKSTAPTSDAAESLADFQLTNPNRVLYAEQGITKLDLATYYFEVSDWMLPHLADRPLTLVRSPHGKQTACFYQKHSAPGMPKAFRTVLIERDGVTEDFLVVDDVLGLVSLVQIGVVEIHCWGSRCDRPHQPDRVIFDLDPSPETVWTTVVESALEMRDALTAIGLTSFVKTTGGNGLHIVCPLTRRRQWDEVKQFARDFAAHFASTHPGQFTTSPSKAARTGKIYIDYQRNNMGASTVAPFSTRAKAEAPVSVPVTWEELPNLRPGQFRLQNLRTRLAELQDDPWADFWDCKQSITAKMLRGF